VFFEAEKTRMDNWRTVLKLSRWSVFEDLGVKSRTIEPIPLIHLAKIRRRLSPRWRCVLNFHLYTGQRAETAISASAQGN
jgi:hypothetical protein